MYNLLIDNELAYARGNCRYVRSGSKALGPFIERSCKTQDAGPTFAFPLAASEFVMEDLFRSL